EVTVIDQPTTDQLALGGNRRDRASARRQQRIRAGRSVGERSLRTTDGTIADDAFGAVGRGLGGDRWPTRAIDASLKDSGATCAVGITRVAVRVDEARLRGRARCLQDLDERVVPGGRQDAARGLVEQQKGNRITANASDD